MSNTTRQRLTYINSIWKGAVWICLIVAIVLVMSIVRYSQNKYHAEVQYSSNLAIQTAKPTAEMAVEFLDSNMAGIVTEGLIDSDNFNRVQIFDDFGKLLEESSRDIPIDGFYGWVANTLPLDLVKVDTVQLPLSNGRHGEFVLEINTFPLFKQVASETIIFIFFALIMPFIFGLILYMSGPYKLKKALSVLQVWVNKTNVNHQLPLPSSERLYFYEIRHLGERFADVMHNLSDQLHENEAQRAEMVQLSITDPLTGCRNRRFLDSLNLSEDRDQTLRIAAMVFFDIDDFKYINGRFGHSIGDKILKMFGRTLLSEFKKLERFEMKAEVIRFGGDEFLIVLLGTHHFEDLSHEVKQVCENVHANIGKASSPELQGHTIKATTGYFIERRRNVSLSHIVDDVTTAMGLLKGLNKGEIINLSSERRYSVSRRQTIRKDFNLALEKNAIYLNYQPIIDIKQNRICGYEALIRWSHPTLGNIKPYEFVHYLETGPMAAKATHIMIEKLFKDIERINLSAPEHEDIYISFNLSGHQIISTDIVALMRENLAKYQIRPQQIQIEITEAIEIIIIDSVKKQLTEMQKMGIGIALDDFGTGYSAIKLLVQLPITKLKIDRTILHGDFSQKHRYSLLHNLNAMCHDLGVSTICEGIENEEQLALTLSVGCDELQGFYFSEAVKISEISLANNKAHKPIASPPTPPSTTRSLTLVQEN